jgi:MFS family permease
LLVVVFVFRCGLHMVEPYVVLWIRELGPLPWIREQVADLEHAIDRTTALAFTILAVAQLLFTPTWGRLADRVGPLLLLAINALLLALLLATTAAVVDVEQFLLLRCAAAVPMAGSMTLAYAAVTKRVSLQQKALAFALAQSCIQFGLALGPMAGGFLSRDLGLRGLYVVAAIILLLAGAGMLWLRRLPAREVTTPFPPIPDVRV